MTKKKMTIEISYTRKITVNKIIEVDEKTAQRALALDETDLTEPTEWSSDVPCDWTFITEDLTDSYHDILDMEGEIENLSVREYKKKPKN